MLDGIIGDADTVGFIFYNIKKHKINELRNKDTKV